MKKRKNIIISAITCLFSICLMMFGVYAASNPSVSIGGQVSYTARDAKVLVLGKVNGQAGEDQENKIAYPTVENTQNPSEDFVSTASQYLGYTKGDSTGQSSDDLPKWDMGKTPHVFYEDSTGIRPIVISFKMTNLSNYPVVATVEFVGVSEVELESKNLKRVTTGLNGNKAYLDKDSFKIITITYSVANDALAVNGDGLLDMNISFEKTVFPTPAEGEVEIFDSDGSKYSINQNDWKYTYIGNSFVLDKFVGTFPTKDADGNSSMTIPGTVVCTDGNTYPVLSLGKYTYSELEKIYEDLLDSELDVEVQMFDVCSLFVTKDLFSLAETELQEWLVSFPTKIILTNGIENINFFAFAAMQMTKIQLPSSLKCIDDEAFENSALNNVVIPEAVRYIGGGAFNNCPLENVGILQTNVSKLQCDTEIFGTVQSGSNFKIYIPVEGYKTAQNWSDYKEFMVIGKYAEVVSEQTINDWRVEIYSDNTANIIGYVGDTTKEIVTVPSSFSYDGKNYAVYAIGDTKSYTDVETVMNSSVSPVFYSDTFGNVLNNISSGNTSSVSVKKIVVEEGVQVIGNAAFAECLYLEELVLPESLKNIMYISMAFSGISAEKSEILTIPDSFTNIPDYSFFYAGIKQVKLPSNLQTIGNWAFGNSGLTDVFVPATVTTIEKHAFYGTSLCTLEFENGSVLRTIGEGAFSNDGDVDTKLTNLVIPESVEYIGNDAFRRQNKLTNLTLGKNIVYLSGFEGTGLTEITIPGNVKNIGSRAFANCESLVSVTIENGVEIIDSEAFSYCKKIESIVIPDSVTDIKELAFVGCDSLKSVTIKNVNKLVIENAQRFGQYFNSIFSADDQSCLTIENCDFSNFEAGKSTHFPFSSVIFADGVTKIESETFRDVKNLKQVTIGKYVKNIGDYAFSGCTALTSVVLEDGLSNLGGGRGIFDGCTGLKSITIPKSITTWGKYIFSGSGLSSVTLSDGLVTIGDSAFLGCKSLEYVKTPASLTQIGEYAFSGCSGLKSVILIDGLVTIGPYAFDNCAGLTSLIIPESVKDIQNGAFSHCGNLSSVTLNKGLNTIGSEAFSYTLLNEICIPETVTNIGDDAFFECESLMAFIIQNANSFEYVSDISFSCYLYKFVPYRYNDDMSLVIQAGDFSNFNNSSSYEVLPFSKIELGDGVAQIPDNLFYHQVNISKMILGKNITMIGEQAFYYCRNISTITLSQSLKSIGDGAFGNCRNISTITLPQSLKSIGDSAFDSCFRLAEIINKSELNLTQGSLDNGRIALYAVRISSDESIIETRDDFKFVLGDDNVTYLIGYFGDATDITLPSIGKSYAVKSYAFHNEYEYINSVEVSEEVVAFGEGAFWNGNITTMTIHAKVPPTCENGSVQMRSITNIYVPAESVELYQTATGWKNHAYIISAINE